MRLYQKIKLSSAAHADLARLQQFLVKHLSPRGMIRYTDDMMFEIQSLSLYADLFHTSRYADIRAIHPKARRMVSYNKRWVYVFHIEDDVVIVDRILPAKMIRG